MALGAARRLACESGQAVAEFSLILLPFVVLLLGVGLVGIALNDWIDETHLSSQAARFLSVDQNCFKNAGEAPHACEPGYAENQAEILSWIKGQGDNTQVKNTAASICSPTSTVGDYVEVKLDYLYKWEPLTALAKVAKVPFGTETHLTSTARMRIEVPPATAYPTKC